MTKSIFQFSTSEIDQIATKFRKALGLEKSPNTRQQASYSPLKCAFKVGSESIYDLSVLDQRLGDKKNLRVKPQQEIYL